MIQTTTAKGRTITVALRNGTTEAHKYATSAEAAARAGFINAAMEWLGAPFLNCAAIKPVPCGERGAVDCAMLLARAAIDSGLIAEFDPRPYPPAWHVHRDEERFIGWLQDKLHTTEVSAPRVGDVLVYKFGRCFSHGAIMINSAEIVHAWSAARCCVISGMDEPLLATAPMLGARPVRFFDVWNRGR